MLDSLSTSLIIVLFRYVNWFLRYQSKCLNLNLKWAIEISGITIKNIKIPTGRELINGIENIFNRATQTNIKNKNWATNIDEQIARNPINPLNKEIPIVNIKLSLKLVKSLGEDKFNWLAKINNKNKNPENIIEKDLFPILDKRGVI